MYVMSGVSYDYDYFMCYKTKPLPLLTPDVMAVIKTIDDQLEEKMSIIKKKKKKNGPSDVYNPKAAIHSGIFKPNNTSKFPMSNQQKQKQEQLKFNRELNLALNGLTDLNLNTIVTKINTIFSNYNSIEQSVIIPIVTEQIISKSLMQAIYTEQYSSLLASLLQNLEYGPELLLNIKAQLALNMRMVETKDLSKPMYKGVCLLYISLYYNGLLDIEELTDVLNYNMDKLHHSENEIKDIVSVGMIDFFMFIHSKKIETAPFTSYIENIKDLCDVETIPMNIRIRLLDVKDAFP